MLSENGTLYWSMTFRHSEFRFVASNRRVTSFVHGVSSLTYRTSNGGIGGMKAIKELNMDHPLSEVGELSVIRDGI